MRSQPVPPRTDLLVQTGFNGTASLRSAQEMGIPFLIMESPSLRYMYDVRYASNFTYNGLQAGGTRPPVPDEPRPHPKLWPMKLGKGKTLIFGQKMNDHSLRGSDHVKWIKEKMIEYPDSVLRHNPMMVPKDYQGPLMELLEGDEFVQSVSFTSTASVESLIMGLGTIAEHPANECYNVTDREEWIHMLSWHNFHHDELEDSDIAAWILTGYEEARANAAAGKFEIPREKMNPSHPFQEYFSAFT